MTSGKDRWNKIVFRCRRNEYSDWADVTSWGRLFHTRGAATGKARLPTDDSLTCGTTRQSVLVERSGRRPGTSATRTNIYLWLMCKCYGVCYCFRRSVHVWHRVYHCFHCFAAEETHRSLSLWRHAAAHYHQVDTLYACSKCRTLLHYIWWDVNWAIISWTKWEFITLCLTIRCIVTAVIGLLIYCCLVLTQYWWDWQPVT